MKDKEASRDYSDKKRAGSSPDNEVSRREILCWAMYDVANSSYVTVVNTAIFNAYFVGTIAASLGAGKATFLLTLSVAISNLAIVITAPVIGSLADCTASKKRLLLVSTVFLFVLTAMLSFVAPGQVLFAVIVLSLANLMFGTGENLIAAFLPELASQERMGRVSAFGWTLGYFGGLATLSLCLAYVAWAERQGQPPTEYVPVTMIIVAIIFALAATPTFLGLKERAKPVPLPEGKNVVFIGFERVWQTFRRASHYRDLLVFLLSLTFFTSGSTTVALMAAVFAKEVMDFSMSDTITMLMVVQLAGSAGASAFGALQDRIGSVKAVAYSLVIWIISVGTVYFATSKVIFFGAAVLMGFAMGACQSSGRALVGQFSPPGRSAEFFGLWGLAVKLAAIIGPISYGLLTNVTGGNYRTGLLSTISFFVLGLIVLFWVDEKRGRRAAKTV